MKHLIAVTAVRVSLLTFTVYCAVRLRAVAPSSRTGVSFELHDFPNRHRREVGAPHKTVASAYGLPFPFLFLLYAQYQVDRILHS